MIGSVADDTAEGHQNRLHLYTGIFRRFYNTIRLILGRKHHNCDFTSFSIMTSKFCQIVPSRFELILC